jgi:adenylosuccinate lyase
MGLINPRYNIHRYLFKRDGTMEIYENYQSPFSWRYASQEMRQLWSEVNKRRLWRKIWLALASTQMQYGLVTSEQVSEISDHLDDVDMAASLETEAEIHHDLMAELKTFASQCPTAGGVLHMGATSTDIEDNADALRLRSGLGLLLKSLKNTILTLVSKMEETHDLPIMAYTHLQPAEPSTMGYRLASYAQDLLEDWQKLKLIYENIRGKGFKGAVGTAAAYGDLIGVEHFQEFEDLMSNALNLPFYPVTTQTYPRKQDYIVLSALAGLGQSLHKFAFDMRLLQTPSIGEVSEQFGKNQVGSSAMPFKRNPINAEKIDSLARQLSMYPQIAWQNAANSLLERTLDDSANRRTILPEAFLICDELLAVSGRLIQNLDIHNLAIQKNLEAYAPFACTERIMMQAGKKGADRQKKHELLREHALTAWQIVQNGGKNPLVENLKNDSKILEWVSGAEIDQLLNVADYTGIAKVQTLALADRIRRLLD